MIRWAVTGPAGGGKSTLCRLLAERGAAVVDGDILGHEVLTRPAVIDEISGEFGPGVMNGDKIDRAALGQIVFQDQSALDRLNRITLSPIAELATARLDGLAALGRYRLAVLEAAVYFLFPPVPGVDLVITVTADPAIRMARLMDNGSLDLKQVQARLDAQRPLEKAWSGADLVVDNSGSLGALETVTAELWARLDI